MFILEWIRFLCGYIIFETENGFPERFLNLCAKQHIPLWDVTVTKNHMHGKTTISGYLHIRKAAFGAGVHLHILKRKGLPFFLKENHKRVGLAFGFLLFCLIISFLSSMVWSVRVVGNEAIETETILETAKALGIDVGVRKNTLDAESLAEALEEKLPQISWAAVNIDFSTVQIEIREAKKKPPMADMQTPANLIAAEDGILTRLDVYSGTPAQLEGSAVIKGDLLISGILSNKDNSERLKGADGHAYAKVERPFSFAINNLQLQTIQESKKRRVLYFFHVRFPFRKPKAAQPFVLVKALENGKTILPLGIEEEHYRKIEDLKTPLEQSTLRGLAFLNLAWYQKDLLEEGNILEESLKETDSLENYALEDTFILEKDIGKKQQIFVEKISD